MYYIYKKQNRLFNEFEFKKAKYKQKKKEGL